MNKGKNISKLFGIVLVGGIGLVCAGFFVKACPYSGYFAEYDKAVFRTVDVTTMGSIYDRNNNLIGEGTMPGEEVWAEEFAESMSNVMGAGVTETMAAKNTVLGKASVLYGVEQNYLEKLNPFAERVGGDIRLTVDAKLQTSLTKLLKEKGYAKAGILVMNYKTGEILASVSVPNFNLNKKDTLVLDTNGYVDDSRAESMIFKSRYMVGSTIKPILFAAALECNPELVDYTYDCNEHTHSFGNCQIEVSCSGIYHGLMQGMDAALPVSCNGYAIEVARQVDQTLLLEKLKKFGFDDSLSFKNQLTFADADFLGGSTTEQDMILASIGGANCSSSLLGMGIAYAAIMNDGVLVPPRLIDAEAIEHGGEMISVEQGETITMCSSETAATVKFLMKLVTEEGTGSSMKIEGYQIASKTGTATGAGADGTTNNLWAVAGIDTEDNTESYLVVACVPESPKVWTSGDVAGGIVRETFDLLLNN